MSRPAVPAVALVATLFLSPLIDPRAVAQEELPGIFSDILEVRVVNVEVVVTDKNGERVHGLSPEDFVLRVDGQEVPIDYFSEVRGGKAVAPEGKDGKKKDAPAALPSLAPGSDVETSYLVFIDEFFTLPRDRNRVLKRLMDQLPLLDPGSRMAVVAFDGRRLDMLTSWTGSVAALERTLRDALFRPSYGLQRLAEMRDLEFQNGLAALRPFYQRAYADDIIEGAQLDPNERAFALLRRQQLENAMRAATATLRSFASPPGRRVMLLMAGGWPFDPFQFAATNRELPVFEPGAPQGRQHLYGELADTANMLGYTLYPVDMAGLEGSGLVTADRSVPDEFTVNIEEAFVTAAEEAGSLTPRNNPVINRDAHLDYEQHGSLHYLARQTGGRALINAEREAAFERAVSDTRSYYWLGFTPAREGDDRRHSIEVEVRRPSLAARARGSFLHSSRNREVTMMAESALLFGNPPTSNSLPFELGEPERNLGSMRVPLTIAIPMDSVTMLPVEGEYRGRVELRVAALDDQGRRSEVPVVPIQLAGSTKPEPGSYSRYETILRLRRESQEVVLSLYDPLSGEILSTNIQIEP